MTPQEWLVELQSIADQQIADIRAEMRAEAEKAAQSVERSAMVAGGAVRSASVTETPEGATVTVTATPTGQRMVLGALERAQVRESDLVAPPVMSTDGMVLSQ